MILSKRSCPELVLDEETKEFFVYQDSLSQGDADIWFGPLKTKLSHLFALGFRLEVSGKARSLPCKYKIHLIRESEKYVLGKVSFAQLREDPVLSEYVFKQKRVAGGWSVAPTEKLVVKRKLIPNPILGNQTLYEKVSSTLEKLK